MKSNHLKTVAVTPMESSVSALRLMASTDAPSLPPTTKPLSFSICKILGLEDTVETVKHFSNSVMVEGQSGYSSSHCKASSCSVCNYSCPGSSPSSDCTFSSSDIENDPVSRQSGKLPWTRRHCAAFLSNEGPKVERVFKWQPYSFSAKVDEPMGSTGISAKSQRTWFQYHSAEKRKQVEKNSQAVFHSNPQMPCDRHCSRIHVGSYDRITARGLDERAYFTELFRRLENPPNPLQKHFSGVYNSPFQSNQMRRSSYFQRPELNQEWPPRTKYAAKYARQPLGRSYRRHQPYQTMRPPSRF